MALRPALLVLLLAGLVAVLLLRDPLGRQLYPEAALDGLLAEAEAAQAAGDLLRATALLQAAAARNPDHPRLPTERGKAAERALSEIDARLAAAPDPVTEPGALDEVEALLQAAQALGAPREALERRRLRLAALAEPPIEALLERAVAAQAEAPEAALADYLRVLAREPGNAVARHGRSQVLSLWLAEAGQALDRGDREGADLRVRRVRALDAAHLDLPAIEARLAGQAGRDAAAAPAVDPAVAAERARQALRWLGLAEEALGRGALDTARRALDQAALLAPEAAEREALEQRYRNALSAAR